MQKSYTVRKDVGLTSAINGVISSAKQIIPES